MAVLVGAQHVLFDVEAHGAGDGVGHHQRRRGQEGLLGVRVDASVKVAVAGQHCSGIQVTVDDFLLDLRVQRTGHAVTGRARIGDDAEAKLLQLRQQARLFQVQLGHLRAWRKRRLHPGLAYQPQFVGLFGQQARRDHVARVGGIGAAGDGGDDHRAIRQQAFGLLDTCGGQLGLVGDATLVQCRRRQTLVRVARAGHVAHHAGQVEFEHALVLGAFQGGCPQAGFLGVLLDQGNLLRFAAGQFEVLDGLLVDVEHRRGGAVLRAHVGNGGAITDGQTVGALAEELDPGSDDTFLAQELGQREDDIGGGDAGLTLAGELDPDDVGQAHHRRQAEHHGLGLQAADADGDDAQCIDVRRM